MGCYIQVPHRRGKTGQIIDAYGGQIVARPGYPDDPNKILVCVVDNGPFEAAAVCYSRQEFREFADPKDNRPKTWILMNLDQARKAAPSLDIYLDGGN